jgi:hypothetical protein
MSNIKKNINAFVFLSLMFFCLEKQIHLRLQSAISPKGLPLWHLQQFTKVMEPQMLLVFFK